MEEGLSDLASKGKGTSIEQQVPLSADISIPISQGRTVRRREVRALGLPSLMWTMLAEGYESSLRKQ